MIIRDPATAEEEINTVRDAETGGGERFCWSDSGKIKRNNLSVCPQSQMHTVLTSSLPLTSLNVCVRECKELICVVVVYFLAKKK